MAKTILATSAASRFGAAIVGGYAFAYGFVALMTLACVAAGLRFSDAQSLAFILALLVYLAALMWAFVPRTSARAWLLLGGGGGAMSTAAWAISWLAGG